MREIAPRKSRGRERLCELKRNGATGKLLNKWQEEERRRDPRPRRRPVFLSLRDGEDGVHGADLGGIRQRLPGDRDRRVGDPPTPDVRRGAGAQGSFEPLLSFVVSGK